MVLVTGGAGYIGSHTVLELLEANKGVIVLDNLSNSTKASLERIERLTGKHIVFIYGDVRDHKCVEKIFRDYDIDSVIHFAGLKSVFESKSNPLAYYDNNVSGTINLCLAMAKSGVFNLVFSSSATVYGEPKMVPIKESDPTGNTTNPYGASKYYVENILFDLAISDPRWSIVVLRYFNPVGAHESGLIGEEPKGVPNNLVPYIGLVATKKLKELKIFGGDYATKDGTGIRDYIHVVDLSLGHLKSLSFLKDHKGCIAINLGTGNGHSVLDVVKTFEEVSLKKIAYSVVDRRPGDIAECFSSPQLALKLLGWQAEKTLEEMLRDAWRWQKNNPEGYLA